MINNSLSSRDLALCAALATFSAIAQLMHIGYQSALFGMWIDLVASSWILAYFLLGTRAALITSAVGALIITLFSPETWLGAIMKWTTTCPMWLSLSIWSTLTKKAPDNYQHFPTLILPLITGLFLRSLITLPLNYYFAIPIWTGMSATTAMAAIPWYVIVIFNLVQGFIDVLLAWIITFHFKLIKFAKWS